MKFIYTKTRNKFYCTFDRNERLYNPYQAVYDICYQNHIEVYYGESKFYNNIGITLNLIIESCKNIIDKR